MSRLADFGVGNPDANNARAGSFWVLLDRGDGSAERVRANGATLILDAKGALGIANSTNTAYGPDTNERLRTWAQGRGVAVGELPPPAAQWRAGQVLPVYVLRLLAWAAYGAGVPLSSVVLDQVTRAPKWGERASGGRVAVERDTVRRSGGPSVSVQAGADGVQVQADGGNASSGGNTSSGGGNASSGGNTSSGGGNASSGGNTSSGGNASSSSSGDGCVATLPGSWHLRPTATAATAGREYPAGSRVVLLEAVPSVTRGPAERFYRVRVVEGGAEGWAFVPVASLPACAARAEVGAAVGAAVTAGAEAWMTALRWTLGAVLVGGVAAGAVAVVRSRRARPYPQGMRPAMAPPPPASRTTAVGYAMPAAPPPGLVVEPLASRGASNPVRRFRRVA